MVFNSASEVNIPPTLSPLQRYETWWKVLQRACECCLLLSWDPYALATLWENSEMWSIDHHFPLWAEEGISPPWAPRRAKIPSMHSLRFSFPPALCLKAWKYTHTSRGLLRDLTFPETCTLKPAFSSYHNSIWLPPSSDERHCLLADLWGTKDLGMRHSISLCFSQIPKYHIFLQLTWPSNYLTRTFASPWSEDVSKDNVQQWGVS